jgi:hypothetical protein
LPSNFLYALGKDLVFRVLNKMHTWYSLRIASFHTTIIIVSSLVFVVHLCQGMSMYLYLGNMSRVNDLVIGYFNWIWKNPSKSQFAMHCLSYEIYLYIWCLNIYFSALFYTIYVMVVPTCRHFLCAGTLIIPFLPKCWLTSVSVENGALSC